MVHRTYFECVCSFSVTGKWHLAEEYDLRMISRLQACDRMVALPTVIKREGCLEIIAGNLKWKESKAGTVQYTDNYKEMVEKQKRESKNHGIFEFGRDHWRLSSHLSNQNRFS